MFFATFAVSKAKTKHVFIHPSHKPSPHADFLTQRLQKQIHLSRIQTQSDQQTPFETLDGQLRGSNAVPAADGRQSDHAMAVNASRDLTEQHERRLAVLEVARFGERGKGVQTGHDDAKQVGDKFYVVAQRLDLFGGGERNVRTKICVGRGLLIILFATNEIGE